MAGLPVMTGILTRCLATVIPVLVAGIHVLTAWQREMCGCRDKPCHDDGEAVHEARNRCAGKTAHHCHVGHSNGSDSVLRRGEIAQVHYLEQYPPE